MVRFGKRAAALAAAGMFAALSVTGCSGSIDTDAVVATVGGEEISLGMANFYARMMQGEYETYYAGMMGTTAREMWAQDAGDGKTYEESMKDSIMENLENLYIISQHAADYEVTLSADEQKAIEDTAAQFSKDNTDEAKEIVSGYQKYIEKFLELSTIQNKMYSKMREGVDEEVSDEEAAQKSMQYVYFSYTTTDDSGNSVDLTDEEKENLDTSARNLSDRVKNGEDMETVAEELDVEVQTATFDSESTTPNEDLVAAADALAAEGAVTDVIETDSGLYVGRLTSLLDREATDQEKENIIDQRRQSQYDSLLEEWRDAAEIEVNEKIWKKVEFDDTGVTFITPEEETSEDGTSEGVTTQDGAADSAADDAAAEDGSTDTAGTDTTGADTAE